MNRVCSRFREDGHIAVAQALKRYVNLYGHDQYMRKTFIFLKDLQRA